MSHAEDLLRECRQAKTDRANFDTHYQEIAERILPHYGDFTTTITPGQKLQTHAIDAMPTLALDRFATAVESMIVPGNSTWHRLRATDRELMNIHAVKVWFDRVNQILVRARQQSRFQPQVHEHFLQTGAFGTSGMAVMPKPKGGIFYKTMPLGKTWIKENDMGEVDTVYRLWEWTALQAKKRFGEDNLPQILKDDLADSKTTKYNFWQVIKLREDVDPTRLDFKGMAFASFTIFEKEAEILEETGFRTWPIPMSRYTTSAGETYGRSVAMTALPDIKMLNEMNKTMMRSAHKMVDPPLLLHDDMMGFPIRMKPNSLNFGGVNSDGNQLIQPLASGANPALGEAMMEQKREIINDIFFVTLFQILVEGPNRMTATEVIERTREKGQLLAPAMGRQQIELLDPMIERELDILNDQGALPEMPPEMIEAQGDFEIRYDSPLSRAQQAEQAGGLFRTIEAVTPIATVQPEVLDRFNWDKIVVDLGDLNAMPAEWMHSDAALEAIKENRAQQEQAAQLLAAAPVVTEASKNIAETQAISQAGPAGRV